MAGGRAGGASCRGLSVWAAALWVVVSLGCGEVRKSDGDADAGPEADAANPDDTAPTVTETDPVATAASVAVGSVVTATFSEGMDPATLTSSSFLVTAAGTPVEGVVSYEGLVATFTPNARLAAGMPYLATITTDASDEAGNELAEAHTWAFTTVTTACVKMGGGDGCQPNIAAAIAAAVAGDSIAVAAGMYSDNLVIDKTVTLLGGFNEAFDRRDPGAMVSEIRAANQMVSVVQINGLAGDTAAVAPMVDGFTVTGARVAGEHGGGFRCASSDVHLRNNVVIDNQAFFLGGGIYVQNGAALLVGNRVEGNVVSGQDGSTGGGIMLEQTQATLIDNVVVGNNAPIDQGAGGGIKISGGGPVRLINNQIEGNQAGVLNFTGNGGGIAITNAEVHIVGGVIAGNETVSMGSGAGLFAVGSVVTLEGVTIQNNGAGPMGGNGSGISIDTTPITIGSALVSGNRNGQAGIWIGPGSPAAIINCTVSDNPGAGIRTESALTLANSIVLDQMVGVNLAAAVPIIASNNDFFANQTDAVGFAPDSTNIFLDPVLDPTTLHLLASSPLLDVGAPGSFTQAGGTTTIDLPAIDVDGQPRAMIGPSDARRVDIGADEYAD